MRLAVRTPITLALVVSLPACSLLGLDGLSAGQSAASGGSDAATSSGVGGEEASGSASAGGGGSAGDAGGASTSTGGGGDGDGGGGGGPSPTCEDDDSFTALAREGGCYRRSRAPATWLEARDLCAGLGGDTHLATITTDAELGVHGLLYPDGCEPDDDGVDDGDDPCDERAFVGAIYEGDIEGVADDDLEPFAWVTGEAWTWPLHSVEPWSATTEPNEKYLALWREGTFDGRPNETTLPYICETPTE